MCTFYETVSLLICTLRTNLQGGRKMYKPLKSYGISFLKYCAIMLWRNACIRFSPSLYLYTMTLAVHTLYILTSKERWLPSCLGGEGDCVITMGWFIFWSTLSIPQSAHACFVENSMFFMKYIWYDLHLFWVTWMTYFTK